MRPIKIDARGNPEQPTFVLATRSARRLGKIPGTHSWKYHKIFNGADEIFFDVEKSINSEPNPLWDEVMDLRLVWFVEVDTWFQIATEVDEGATTVKHVTGTALSEAELSQVNVYDLEINTESDILRDNYIDPTVFYDPAKPECSLLDRMLYKFPNYSIGHVDLSLRNVQRQFSLTDTSVYDAFQSVSQEIGCLFVFDSGTNSDTGLPKRTIHAYDLQSYCNNCGKRFEEHTTICPHCGSGNTQAPYGDESKIIVSQDNLTEDIQLTSDVDSTKNCLRLQGGDDAMTAAIRHCTPDGSGYIWYISDDMRKDMSDELRERLDSFDALSKAYQTGHDFIVDSDAYNALVTKYDPDYDEYSRIFSGGTTGTGTDIVLGSYTDLVEADYSAYDFYYYLHDSMMPTYTRPDYDVQTQVLNLRTGLTSGISLLNISSSTSASTAESALRSMSRHYVNTGKYNISVSTDSWSVVGGNTGIWSGSITLTNSRDNTDTASTGTITVSFSSDPEQYMDQLIQNKIDAALASDYDIASVFSLELDDFVAVLPAYSLSVLKAYHDCCQTCIDVLIQQGCGNPDGTTTGGITWDAYNELYLPWRSKLLALEDEIAIRTAEVDTVLDMIDQVESRINETHNILDLETYLGETLWKEFIPYRREDEYTNTNFISDGLTNAEIITLSREFINLASKELYKSAELQHSISSTLHNLLIMKEFQPLADNFDVGVWIWVIIDDKPYKLRLLEYTIDWDASDKIDVEFSDVSHWASTYTDLQSVLNSARNMTTTYGALTRKADEASTKMKWFDDGINATTMAVTNNNTDQSMQFNKNGLYMFGYDSVIDAFTDEQLKILNDVIAFTDDGWKTVKVALGKIVVDGVVKYGILAENIYGRMGKFVELDADTLTAGTISDRNGYNYWNLETGEFRLSSTAGIGVTGKTVGDLIIEVDVEYALGDSSDTAPSTGWSTDGPTWTDGKYIWQRTATKDNSGGTNYSDPVCIQGASGSSGEQGIGISGVTEYYLATSQSSGVTTETQGWTTDVTSPDATLSSEKKYLWNYEVIRYTNNTSSLTDPCIMGVYGDDGSPGENSYVHIKYSAVANPTDADLTETPSDYIGICTDNTRTDPTTAASYTWAKWKGEDGPQGNPGVKGDDGETSYVHLAYCIDPGGQTAEEIGFSTSSFDGALYLGVYTDHTEDDSETVGDYDWSLIVGGDGIGIQSVTNYYLASDQSSGITTESEGWTTDVTSSAAQLTATNKYLWNYEVISYTDGTSGTPTAPCIIGIYGDQGTGIVSLTEQYYLSTSDSEQTGGEWSEASPAWSSGHHIWTRSEIVWDNGVTTYTDPVLARALNSANETATTANSTANAASAAVTALDQGLDSTGVFNRLTNNGAIQGLYMDENGNLYVNATYIKGGTLDANQMTVSNLSANSITTGTFDASKITVANLSASAITSGTMSADRISGGTIDASDVTITNLDADNITSGTITANYISGGTLNFNNVTVTGNLSASRINGGTLDFDNFQVNHLSASDISTGTLSADYISGGTIDASDVTITNLNADNISTGHLSSSNIKLIGNMEVYNNSGSSVGGYFGYAESTSSNTGMHMQINYTSNLGGYWSTSETICTNSGCRMSYSYSESSLYSIAQVFVSYESGYGGAYCGIGNGNYPTNLVFNGGSSSQTTYVYGKLNFSNATVTGLNVTATFG